MIAFVSGRVAAVTLSSVVVDVNGFGMELLCTPATLATLKVGESATLHTAMIVREDSMTLFGFLDGEERSLFNLLQTASGVGPKVAQSALAVLSPDTIRSAIAGGDVKLITKVPGIGPKGAQRIILELKDKVGLVATSSSLGGVGGGAASWRDQVHEGLVGLGWSAKEADKAVEAVAPLAETNPDVGGLLRAALKSLSKA